MRQPSARQQINVRLDPDVMAAIEEIRRLRTPIPSKSEVIRRAVLNELEREQRKASKK